MVLASLSVVSLSRFAARPVGCCQGDAFALCFKQSNHTDNSRRFAGTGSAGKNHGTGGHRGMDRLALLWRETDTHLTLQLVERWHAVRWRRKRCFALDRQLRVSKTGLRHRVRRSKKGQDRWRNGYQL